MAIIVEDGSNVPNANSYVTVADCRTFADARGLSLSADDVVVEQQLILATDYLEGYRNQYLGYKTYEDQPLQFPRSDLYIDCILQPDDTIPKELKDAQCQLAVEQQSGIELTPTQVGKFITKEQVGPLKTEYSDKINTNGTPVLTSVDNFLKPLIQSCSFGDIRNTLRI